MGLEDVVGATDKKDKYGSTPLDCALRTGSSGNCLSLVIELRKELRNELRKEPLKLLLERLPEKAFSGTLSGKSILERIRKHQQTN